jgi:hypothetical protein
LQSLGAGRTNAKTSEAWMKIERHGVAATLEFRVAGEVLLLDQVFLTAVWAAPDADITELRLTADLDFFQWARLEGGPAFGFDTQARPQLMSGQLDPGRPLQIEARLRPEHLAALPGRSDAADVVSAVASAGPDSPLRQAESWEALALTQLLQPGLRGGFVTYSPT